MFDDQADASAQLDRRGCSGRRHQRHEGVRHVIVRPWQWLATRIGGLPAGWNVRVLSHPERFEAALLTGACQFVRARAISHIVAEDTEMQWDGAFCYRFTACATRQDASACPAHLRGIVTP